MDPHLTFKEHPKYCMKKARAAEDRLHQLTRMRRIIPEWVRAIEIAWGHAVVLYGCKLWWDQEEIGRQEDLQLILNQQGRSTLGALPVAPVGSLMRDSGLTTARLALDSRQ